MKKRKQPQQSFESLVSKQSVSNLKPYIDANVDVKMAQVERRLTSQVIGSIQSTFARVLALEEIVMEMNPQVTKDVLSEKVADKIDALVGLKKIDKSVLGCRARLTIESKSPEDLEFNTPSKMLIDNLGSGKSLNLEIENKLIGLESGQSVIIDIPENKELSQGGQFKITLDRASIGEKNENTIQE